MWPADESFSSDCAIQAFEEQLPNQYGAVLFGLDYVNSFVKISLAPFVDGGRKQNGAICLA